MDTKPNGKAHVAVIGAGTVGACCAWYLRRAGLDVTLIDSELPGQSTSFGNAACITPNYIYPFSHPGVSKDIPGWMMDSDGPLKIRWAHLPGLLPWFWKFWRAGTHAGVDRVATAQAQLMRHVTADFDEILDAIGAADLRRSKGVITLYDSPADFRKMEWAYELILEHGFDWQYLGPAELKIMVPELRFEGGVALFYPEWQHVLDPALVTERIADACFADGGTWLQDRVQAVEAEPNGVLLSTESGREVNADCLVVAAGAWSNQIARQLDGTVPLTPKRGYHAQIAEPGLKLDYPVHSGSRFVVMTPLLDGLRLAGTAEFAALDAPPDYRRARVLVDHARHYLPDLRVEGPSEWMGQRPMMADSLPVIGPSPKHANVYYAFGHGHYGLTQGPTTGKIITSLVLGEDSGFDLEPYRFDRF